MMYTYEYPRPALTVDVVVFQQVNQHVQVLLIQRAQPPFQGSWALPGGFVDMDESLEQAAARELAEETGLTGLELIQVHTYGDPQRDPRGRVVSVAYGTYLPKGDTMPVQAGWFILTDLPQLAFDHQQIIQDAYMQFKELLN